MTSTTKHRHVLTVINESLEEVTFWVKGGRLTIDQGQSPYIQGELVIKLPAPEDFGLLDPRTLSFGIFGVSDGIPGPGLRLLLLSIRSREYGQNDDEVVLKVAGFESWLLDFAPLADDATPLSLAASVRDIADYVLGVVGASLVADVPFDWELEATPADDADMTRYWSATNLHPNPLPASVTGYNIAAAGTALTYTTLSGEGVVRWTSSAPTSNLNAGTISAYRATPGKQYYAAWDWASSSSGRSAALVMEFRTSNGTVLMSRTTAPFTPYAAVFQTLTVSAVAPAGTETVYVYVTTTGNTVATMHYVKRFILTESDFPVPFFYGGTPDDANYDYSWTEAANASPSTRVPDVERPPEALVWAAGVSALDFLLPLVQSAGLRLVYDGLTWTLRDESFEASGSLELAYGVNVIEGNEVVDRDAALWYDAQVTVYTWTDRSGIQREAVDSYADGPTYNLVNREELQTPYPGPGYSEYAVRRALQRGREFTVTAMSDWTATAEQPITITLQGVDPQEGIVQSVEFDLESDEMTVKSRAVETP